MLVETIGNNAESSVASLIPGTVPELPEVAERRQEPVEVLTSDKVVKVLQSENSRISQKFETVEETSQVILVKDQNNLEWLVERFFGSACGACGEETKTHKRLASLVQHISRDKVIRYSVCVVVLGAVWGALLATHVAFVLSDAGKAAGYSISKNSFSARQRESGTESSGSSDEDGAGNREEMPQTAPALEIGITLLTISVHLTSFAVILGILFCLGLANHEIVVSLWRDNVGFQYLLLCLLLVQLAVYWIFLEHGILMGGVGRVLGAGLDRWG